MSYRTANPQMLHFIYLFMLHTHCFFLFKMPFIS